MALKKVITSFNLDRELLEYIIDRSKKEQRSMSYIVNDIIRTHKETAEGGKEVIAV